MLERSQGIWYIAYWEHDIYITGHVEFYQQIRGLRWTQHVADTPTTRWIYLFAHYSRKRENFITINPK